MITLFSLRFVPDQRKNFPHGVIQVQLFSGRRSPFCQCPDTGDHVTGSLAIANDIADRFTDFVHIRHVSGQPAQARAAVAHYTGQRLVDFMRDRGGQFPHHAHAVDVREICLDCAASHAFFGTLAIFDVRENSIPPDDLSVLIAQRHATSQKPAIFPIRSATKARLAFERLACSKGRAPLFRIAPDDLPGERQPSNRNRPCPPADNPVYSAQRLFTNALDPSGRTVQAIAGIVSITSLKLLELPLQLPDTELLGCPQQRQNTRPRRGRETSWSYTRAA